MPSYVIEIVSRSGRQLDPITKASHTAIGVYGKQELDRRVAELRNDPHLAVTWRQVDPKVVAQGIVAARQKGLIP